LKAHGALFNNQGFSAELDFHLRDARGEERPITLRTPRFAIGPADPALGLPTPTRFEPGLALHNFAESELPLTVAVGYRTEDGAEELQIPLTISAGDTEVLSLHPYLEGVVPEEAHWASLELGYSSRENQLAAELVSVSADGQHSIRSVLNGVRASNNEGWYWRADADYNTLIAVYNRATEEATVAVSLDYYVEGGRQSYELPERALPGRATEMFDIGQLIAAGVPDQDGDVIPSTVSFGGYRVRKLAPDQDLTLTTEALLFDRRRKTYLSFYNTGCCYDALRLWPFSLTGPVGSQAQVVLEIRNTCFGWEPAEFPTYWSENTGVATINGLGLVSCVGGGTTKVWGRAFYPEYVFLECFFLTGKDSSPVTVESVTVNLSPVTVAPAASTMVTVTVLPAQAGRSVSLQVQEVANSGGHIHLGRPLGSFANPSGTTDANGEFTSSYTASVFGGAETIVAISGSASGNVTLTVRIPNLLLLGTGTNYALIGTTPEHPLNHYGISAFNTGLANLAADYHNRFPALDVIGINDMSLVRGGLFDIDANWQPDHMTHRKGRNADIRANSCFNRPNFIPDDTAVRMAWLDFCGQNGITCQLKFENTCREHYHLILQ
jgi:hypothetical protein